MGNIMGMFPPKTHRLEELSKDQIVSELHPAQKIHIGMSENFNSVRSDDFRRRQWFGTRIALGLAVLSVATYVWTITSLKQERLGPEFDVRIEEEDETDSKTRAT